MPTRPIARPRRRRCRVAARLRRGTGSRAARTAASRRTRAQDARALCACAPGCVRAAAVPYVPAQEHAFMLRQTQSDHGRVQRGVCVQDLC